MIWFFFPRFPPLDCLWWNVVTGTPELNWKRYIIEKKIDMINWRFVLQTDRNIKFTILFIYLFLLSFFIFSVTLPSVRISLPFFYCHLVLGLTPGLFTQHGCCGCMDSNTQRTRLQCTLVWEWSLDMKKLIVSFNWPLLTGFLLLHVRSWPNKKPAMHF